MTSVLPEEESNVTRLKLKSQSHAAHSSSKQRNASQDESRSFLTFSRENLSISTSDLEQGFSKPSRTRCCSRQTLLSCAALILALSCAGLELWKLRRVLENARDIESLKRDVETLKHRFLEKDLLDELRAFEEQIYKRAADGRLYGEGASDEEDLSSNPGSNNSDYDSSYDDSSGGTSSTSADYPTVTFAPNHQPSLSTISIPKLASTSSATPCTSKDLEEVLAVLRRAEAERGQAFEQSVRERERLIESERDRDQRRVVSEHRIQKGDDKPPASSGRKRKREATSAGETWRDKTFYTSHSQNCASNSTTTTKSSPHSRAELREAAAKLAASPDHVLWYQQPQKIESTAARDESRRAFHRVEYIHRRTVKVSSAAGKVAAGPLLAIPLGSSATDRYEIAGLFHQVDDLHLDIPDDRLISHQLTTGEAISIQDLPYLPRTRHAGSPILSAMTLNSIARSSPQMKLQLLVQAGAVVRADTRQLTRHKVAQKSSSGTDLRDVHEAPAGNRGAEKFVSLELTGIETESSGAFAGEILVVHLVVWFRTVGEISHTCPRYFSPNEKLKKSQFFAPPNEESLLDAELSEERLGAEEEDEADSGFPDGYRMVRTGYQVAELPGKLRVDQETTRRGDRGEAAQGVDAGDF
ncbi:hypothetical protein TSAR_013242 [Trichomalopsis sarcophagae]|uniref:Uncharacterized protein n=1 Tax=Trichomalopsis sarcophagae TaxID=543379 RepID=A0A232FGF3_9HYME|nr:hypothetical protein TSAR_013242 [Trichomalopsis sarcophagae]